MKIKTLIRKAKEACKRHKHDMKNFRKTIIGGAWSCCWKCGMTCFVNPNPMPNEIDIGGEAVALNCKEIKLVK